MDSASNRNSLSVVKGFAMEKLGVLIPGSDGTKASEDLTVKPKCAKCRRELDPDTNVPKCAVCGTLPAEEKE
jgi:hypothetical protein